jgi:hypothetical protein
MVKNAYVNMECELNLVRSGLVLLYVSTKDRKQSGLIAVALLSVSTKTLNRNSRIAKAVHYVSTKEKD